MKTKKGSRLNIKARTGSTVNLAIKIIPAAIKKKNKISRTTTPRSEISRTTTPRSEVD